MKNIKIQCELCNKFTQILDYYHTLTNPLGKLLLAATRL